MTQIGGADQVDWEGPLYRRISPEWVVPEDEPGRFRLSTNAFKDRRETGAMSVVLHDVLIELDLDPPTSALEGWDGYGLVSIDVNIVVGQCGLHIRHDPKPGDPGHALVIGKKTGSIQKRLARSATWITWPDPMPEWKPPE